MLTFLSLIPTRQPCKSDIKFATLDSPKLECGIFKGSMCSVLTCVNVFQSPEHLVEEKLVVLRGQVVIGFDDLQAVLTSRPQADDFHQTEGFLVVRIPVEQISTSFHEHSIKDNLSICIDPFKMESQSGEEVV